MYAARLWSVRHARGLNALYRGFEGMLKRTHGVFRALGYERIERPVATIERIVKGALFDCQMCGQCVLSSTGMSCPMNCPKNLRNGPCGGVRDNGHCEVKPEMRCVWVEAYHGSRRIPSGIEAMSKVQFAVDQRLKGRSSWLKVVRELHPEPQAKPVAAKAGAAPAQAATAAGQSGLGRSRSEKGGAS